MLILLTRQVIASLLRLGYTSLKLSAAPSSPGTNAKRVLMPIKEDQLLYAKHETGYAVFKIDSLEVDQMVKGNNDAYYIREEDYLVSSSTKD